MSIFSNNSGDSEMSNLASEMIQISNWPQEENRIILREFGKVLPTQIEMKDGPATVASIKNLITQVNGSANLDVNLKAQLMIWLLLMRKI